MQMEGEGRRHTALVHGARLQKPQEHRISKAASRDFFFGVDESSANGHSDSKSEAQWSGIPHSLRRTCLHRSSGRGTMEEGQFQPLHTALVHGVRPHCH